MRASLEQTCVVLVVLVLCLAEWALVGLGLYAAWSLAR